LRHAYGRWDGQIFPQLESGDRLSATARLVHLVHVAQVYHQVGGAAAADEVVRRRSGTEFDPELARLWLENSHDLLRNVPLDSVWDQALNTEPEPHRSVGPAHLDDVSSALADFVDLASPFTSGHSARVARLAEVAARHVGLDADGAATVRRAAQVHDLGMVSVPNRVWIKRGPLNPAEWERVRLHAYHSQRILSLAAPLRSSATVAGLHHERLDGSGYHRGLPASAVPLPARLVAVAEMYQSMTEHRAWRPALSAKEATRQLRDDVAAPPPDAPAAPRTSGIVQPPVHATAVWQLYRNAVDRDRAERFLRELMPKLVAWHDYLYRERTRDHEGLVELWHPWESGTDNSPLWDEALGRIVLPEAEIPEYQRVDTEVVDSAQRPTNAEYDRYAYLVKCYRDVGYDQTRIREECPFAIQDVLFNAILVRANHDLAEIARVLGEDAAPFEEWATRTQVGLDVKLWNEEQGIYLDYDLRAAAPVAARTWGGLAPLYGGVPSEARARRLVETVHDFAVELAGDLDDP